MENNIYNQEESVDVRIAPDVVASIAGVAAMEADGAFFIASGITGGIDKLLGKKNFSKGIKVEMTEETAVIDIDLVVEFGKNIPNIAKEVQKNIKEAVENMTGLTVTKINVHICGVNFNKEAAPQD